MVGGAVIDMVGSPDMRIFDVQTDNATIKNIVFKNAHFDGDGGAVYWFGLNGVVSNCSFMNNSAGGSGGAIYFAGSYINSYYVGGNYLVTNCSFVNNSAGGDGGAIIINWCNILDCYFVNNSAGVDGGAISGGGSVSNSSFVNNSASGSGGAIYLVTKVINCSFVNNSAGVDGGAIYINVYESKINVFDCNFINNGAKSRGGAIYIDVYDCKVDIIDSNFMDNKAFRGSAVYQHRSFDFSISNSMFLNNRANSSQLSLISYSTLIYIALRGNDNLINAIYDAQGGADFSNVTYWGVDGVMNTGTKTINLSDAEAGQNITLIIDDGESVREVNAITDADGKVTIDLGAGGNYTIAVYHFEDLYYTQANATFSLTLGNPTFVNLTASKSLVIANVSNATGNVSFIVTNEYGVVRNGTVNLTDSIAVFDLYGLKPGLYDITAVYNGDSNCLPSEGNISYNLPKMDSVIIIETLNITVSQSEVINFTVNNKKGGVFTVYINGAKYDVYDGKLTLNNLSEGTYNVVAVWSGNDTDNGASNSSMFKVSRNDVELMIDVGVDENDVEIIISLPSDVDGFVLMNVNGDEYRVNITNGEGKICLFNLPAGIYGVNVEFLGDEKYAPNTNSTSFTIESIAPAMDVVIGTPDNNTGVYHCCFT